MYLINFSNQLAAGPKNISLNFINNILTNSRNFEFIFIVPDHKDYRNFKDTGDVSFIFIEVGSGIFEKIIKTIKVNWIVIPKICKRNNIKGILAFGNFLTYTPGRMKKVVLLHHPHIVDDALFYSLGIFSKLIESTKRFVFSLTVRNVDIVVIQSDFMMDVCVKKFPKRREKFHVIHNPISESLISKILKDNVRRRGNVFFNKEKYKLLYVSRFYPHKNHIFLLNLARLSEELGLDLEFFVTIDPLLPGASEFLDDVVKSHLKIFNLGEIDQSELSIHYENSDFMIFPSNAETFGNPIIESMFFSLPLILPNREYALTLLGDGGAFYDAQSEVECLDLINSFLIDKAKYSQYAEYCYKRSLIFSDPEEWVNSYLDLLEVPGEI